MPVKVYVVSASDAKSLKITKVADIQPPPTTTRFMKLKIYFENEMLNSQLSLVQKIE